MNLLLRYRVTVTMRLLSESQSLVVAQTMLAFLYASWNLSGNREKLSRQGHVISGTIYGESGC